MLPLGRPHRREEDEVRCEGVGVGFVLVLVTQDFACPRLISNMLSSGLCLPCAGSTGGHQ